MNDRERLVREIAELTDVAERARALIRGGRRNDDARAAAGQLERAVERLEKLRRELREIDLRRPGLDPCEAAAIAWLNEVRNPRQLVAELEFDPEVRPRPSRGEAMRVAAGILRQRHLVPEGLQRLADLRRVPGIDRAWLAHLYHTGCRRLPDGPTEQVLGVLLPLRIETRFDPGSLRLRVVPDEPWFARHDPRASKGELEALERYVAAAAVAPDDESAAIAWRELAAHVGGARAVWLLRTFGIQDANGVLVVQWPPEEDLRMEPAFPQIVGLPPELDVWLARGGGAPARVATLVVDHARLQTDFPDPDTTERRWWEDWQEAVDAGLATTIALPGDPNDIDALYVTGLGGDEPAKLFARHRDEGVLGLVRPGTPTNSVDGASAASLATDPATWWDVLRTPAAETDRLVSRALTGDPDLLGNLPGDTEPHLAWNAALVGGLWPALWGFAGDDVWGFVPGTSEAEAWAPHAVFPLGPFPSLRVGSQPYGLLPATSLRRWRAAPDDPALEARLLKPFGPVLDLWRTAAERRGTVASANDADALLDLLAAVSASPDYRQRRAWPLELWWLFALLVGSFLPWADLHEAWRRKYELVGRFGREPIRRYGSLAASRSVEIPLIRPVDMPPEMTIEDAIRRLLEVAREHPSELRRPEVVELEFLQFRLDSVLLRLVLRSLQVAVGNVGRELLGEAPPPDPEPLIRSVTQPGRLERWLEAVSAEDLRTGGASTEAFMRVVLALEEVGRIPEDRLDLFLRATIDSAIYRIDPWALAPAARRLGSLLDGGLAAPRLGAYGWVDQPRPGTPGPTPAGMLFAPSPAQALAAAVIRDRAVNDAEPARWAMDLTSRTVRDADRLAEHVRIGAHLAEAVGREVERVVADPGDVERLRREHPVRAAHEGRRTLDGLAVLETAATDPTSLVLDAARLGELESLRAALDAYGDLLVAEAIHHMAEGRSEAAGAVMDAAAGLARPPRLDLLRTRRPGRSVGTSAILVLDGTDAPPPPTDATELAEQSPSALADAAAAAFVTTQVGAAAAWTWSVARADGTGSPVSVQLSDLGLLPADALALPRDDLERLVREAGSASLGITDGSDVELASDEGSERYERAARLVAVLGRAPATADSATESADGTAPGGTDVDVELRTRYARVRDTAVALHAALLAALAGTTGEDEIGTADPALVARLVVAARRWGIAPDPEPPPTGATTVPDPRVQAARRAAELVAARLAAPVPAANAPREDVMDALAALVSPTGQLAVLSRLTAADLPALARAGAASAVDLEATWLSTVAAVREPLARLEAYQLGASAGSAGAPLVAWSNRPADPWQRDETDQRRLVVVFAAPGVDLTTLPTSGRLAAAVVDRFVEIIPEPEQSAGVAFGFDAPAARAPQAILLAVPPDLDTPLDRDSILDIVAESRDLARVRMARPTELDEALGAFLPTVLLPATGQTAVSLDPTPR